MKTKTFLFIVFSLISTLSFSQDQEGEFIRRHGLGISAGWGAPYGFGVEYSYLLSPNIDMNVGAGFSFSGLRTGLGTRFHFIKSGSSPFIGANFIYTSGLTGLEVSTDDNRNIGEYEIFSDGAVFLRGGYKIDLSYRQILINLGYGFAFDERDAAFIGGQNSVSQQDFANLQALGGIEVSITVVLRIGK